MERIINYGKHAANGTRRINEVTLTVSIEPNKFYNPKTKEHYTNGKHFSVCGDVWNASHTDIIQGGQCVDTIVEKYAKHNKTAQNIRALWEVFHLQDTDIIPERFRAALVEFIEGRANSVILERKNCAGYLLKANEKVTNYGTYTEGTITIKTSDGTTEIIHLSQGDEIKNCISERAHNAIKRLYDNAPSAEDLSKHAEVTTNANEYYAAKSREKDSELAEIKAIAADIIKAVDRGAVNDSSMILYHIRDAKRYFNAEDKKND